MDYKFDFNAMFIGIVIMCVGVLFLRFYKSISDFFVIPYGKFRLASLLILISGFLAALNIHLLLLDLLTKIIFRK